MKNVANEQVPMHKGYIKKQENLLKKCSNKRAYA